MHYLKQYYLLIKSQRYLLLSLRVELCTNIVCGVSSKGRNRLRAYISGKSQVHMLLVLSRVHNIRGRFIMNSWYYISLLALSYDMSKLTIHCSITLCNIEYIAIMIMGVYFVVAMTFIYAVCCSFNGGIRIIFCKHICLPKNYRW